MENLTTENINDIITALKEIGSAIDGLGMAVFVGLIFHALIS